MENRFSEPDLIELKKQHPDLSQDLVERIYTSRLIGRNPYLVLHGGGNTSVKTRVKDLLGREQAILFVKGSGHDLASVAASGFSGLRLESLKELQSLDALSDEEMVNQLLISRIDATAPTASIEGLLHAFLPHKFVDHSHADSILILSNREDGAAIVQNALGPKAVVCPYMKPGFSLARGVAALVAENPDAEAVICLNHGIFTFGPDARTAYGRMIHYVNRAEQYINEKTKGGTGGSPLSPGKAASEADIARLAQVVRGAASFLDSTGIRRRFYVEIRSSPDLIAASLSDTAGTICQSGVLTPDHALRTKNTYIYMDDIPVSDDALKEKVNAAVETFRDAYNVYFEKQVHDKGLQRTRLDNSPRVFLAAGAGLLALGFSRKWAGIAADIAEQTIRAKQRAMLMGEYRAVTESHNFDLEYMDLQQQKLEKDRPGDLSGQVAVVTGAAGAIGFGIADRLLKEGAAVVIADIDMTRLKTVHEILSERYGKDRIESLAFDITDFPAVEKALQAVCLKLGGVDIIVPNAGIAHVAKIEDLSPETFSQVMDVNLMGVFNIIKAGIPIFRRQGTGGNIVLISSKNVFDPGAAFGAYSASKAAAHQIARIAALELAELGVRGQYDQSGRCLWRCHRFFKTLGLYWSGQNEIQGSGPGRSQRILPPAEPVEDLRAGGTCR
ncbi:MAG: bifunctional aldolase/short-chain dehydrogenase [bacterium]